MVCLLLFQLTLALSGGGAWATAPAAPADDAPQSFAVDSTGQQQRMDSAPLTMGSAVPVVPPVVVPPSMASVSASGNGRCPRPTRLSSHFMSKLHLWSGLGDVDDDTSRHLPYVVEALRLIHRSQNPPDCATAQYLIVDVPTGGPGATVHAQAETLALAMKLGRVLLRAYVVGSPQLAMVLGVCACVNERVCEDVCLSSRDAV